MSPQWPVSSTHQQTGRSRTRTDLNRIATIIFEHDAAAYEQKNLVQSCFVTSSRRVTAPFYVITVSSFLIFLCIQLTALF